jgi:CRP/FNR family transcriptional regulator, cyclic AMP receptor protein
MTGDIFEQLTFFQDLSAAQIGMLKPFFIPCDLYSGSVLFGQGDPAEFLYLVISGEVTINYKPEDGPAMHIARVRSGGVVGWSAILGNRLYTSEAICADYTQMLRVRGKDLRNLCQDCPETGILILERLAWVIAERLHHTYEQVISLLKQGLYNGLPSVKEV